MENDWFRLGDPQLAEGAHTDSGRKILWKMNVVPSDKLLSLAMVMNSGWSHTYTKVLAIRKLLLFGMEQYTSLK